MRVSLSFSSSSKSSNSAQPVIDIVKKFNEKKLCSCIIAISEINMFLSYIRDISHAAIILLDNKIPDDDE